MGVNSLWDIVGPTARPVRLEALSRKKLAVDASIWIYQFLKAVRDAEGNTLPLSHIVGFFRRICKLLYFGIQPVFIFDGGAPALKRQTINKRRERREGNRESTEQTARKLLAIQVQRQAQGEVNSRKRPKTKNSGNNNELDINGGEVAFLEDLENVHPLHGPTTSTTNIQSNEPHSEDHQHKGIIYSKNDEFHLPVLKEIKISGDDQRMMPKEEYRELAELGTDYVDGIDIDSVDPASKEFEQLPMPTQYMILSHLRLRSRLRMGYNKEQLETLFPNSMEFSKFQILQVQKRNFYTQRLMNVSGMNEGSLTRRIAGTKDREYTLARSENGWTLALGEQDGGATSDKPISLDEFGNVVREPDVIEEKPTITKNKNNDDSSDDDEDWEEVPIGVTDQPKEEKNVEIDDDGFNKALIQSIYDQYGDTSNNMSTEGFDEVELKAAIEESKKEVLLLKRNEETSRFQNLESIPETSNKQETRIDLGQSFLFGSTELNKEKEVKPIETGFSSFLFSGDDKKMETDTEKVDVENIQTTRSKPKPTTGFSSFLFENEPESKNSKEVAVEIIDDPKKYKRDEPIYETLDLESSGDEKEEVHEQEEPKPKPKVFSNEIPSWFNDSVSETLNPYNQVITETRNEPKVLPYPETTTSETTEGVLGARKRRYLEDEAAGLISWSEAKEMLLPEPENESPPAEDDIMITDYKNVEDSVEEIHIDENVLSVTSESDEVASPTDKGNGSEVPVEEEKEPVPASKETLQYDFEEEDENKLIEQIEQEEREHEVFKTQIRREEPINLVNSMSITEEQLLQEKLQKAKRDSDEVTQTMISDVQELLRRFGIPYITAPMEAEAQCAELSRLGLVDGIVTDDSDCFLFGGDKVYKNMFNQKNYVECYFSSELESRLGLDQNKLIELALLLGSDYTEGIKGIGPVLAMEILAEFGSLREFKRWFDQNTQTLSKPDSSSSLKKSLLLKIKSGKLFLPENFPDKVVADAYIKPEVDDDETQFKWGVPNLDQIRSFLMYNVKWTQGRVDEVLVPLIRDINRKKTEGTQSTIGEFFPQEVIRSKKEMNLSKRIKSAAERLRK